MIKIFSYLNENYNYKQAWFINTINVLKGFCKNNDTLVYNAYNPNIDNIENLKEIFNLNQYNNLIFFNAYNYNDILEYLIKNQIKIVYFRNFLLPLFLIENKFDGKILIESHGEIPNDIYKKLKKNENKFIYVTISNILKNTNNFINTIVCPCAIDYDYFSKKPENTKLIKFEYKFNIVYSGHVYPYKGIPLLIELSKKIKTENILDIGINIIGGNKSDINLYNGHNEYIKFYGWKSQNEILNYVYSADLLILPYTNNHCQADTTTPIKLFEYLATGIPVLSSDINGIKMCAGNNILYYKADDINDLFNQILYIKKNYNELNDADSILLRKNVSMKNSCIEKSKLMIEYPLL